jgi:hypothetical protein
MTTKPVPLKVLNQLITEGKIRGGVYELFKTPLAIIDRSILMLLPLLVFMFILLLNLIRTKDVLLSLPANQTTELISLNHDTFLYMMIMSASLMLFSLLFLVFLLDERNIVKERIEALMRNDSAYQSLPQKQNERTHDHPDRAEPLSLIKAEEPCDEREEEGLLRAYRPPEDCPV